MASKAGKYLLMMMAAALVPAGPGMRAWAAPDAAPDAAPASTSASEDEDVIENIVVTAQKRKQTIQDVPIALSAFTGDDLRGSGIEDFTDLQQIAPALVVTTSTSESSGAVIRIRGVGTTGNNPGLESSVGVFLDGVFLSRAGIALNDLDDIERVEVLRGPQGTLFGKNTSAGAINIITRQPQFTFGGHIEGRYGNFDGKNFKGPMTGPLIPGVLAARISASLRKRDGILTDVNSGRDFNDRDRWRIRGQLLFVPSADSDLRIIFDHGEKTENC